MNVNLSSVSKKVNFVIRVNNISHLNSRFCLTLSHNVSQARIKEGSSPPEGSERDVDFEKNRGYLRDVVKGVIGRRREGLGGEHVPFIDNLLQSGVPDDQVY